MVNNQFCKRIMGLPRKVSNFGVKAELGRNPLFAYICAQAVKYWHKIISMDGDRILKCAYYSEMDLTVKGNNSWTTFVMKLLDLVNENRLWRQQATITTNQNVDHIKKKVTNSIAEQYYNTQLLQINEFSKLRTKYDCIIKSVMKYLYFSLKIRKAKLCESR